MSDATDDDAKPSNKERNSMILDSLDPLDPRKISFDMFELYCQEMLMTSFVGRRVYLIEKTRVRSFYVAGFLFFSW